MTALPMGAIYVMARDCGHRTWFSKYAHSGIDWCPTCNAYVGVIVTRKDTATPFAEYAENTDLRTEDA